MRNVGKVEKFRVLNLIVEAIFSKSSKVLHPPGVEEPIITQFNENKKLWYVDHGGVRYIEQNPKTSSAYAKRSRPPEDGGTNARIVQIYRSGTYLGCVEDGEVFMKTIYANAYGGAARW